MSEIRAVERRLLFFDEGSPRPTLSVPYLLAGESSAYYHGYVLAEIAVHQSASPRDWLEEDCLPSFVSGTVHRMCIQAHEPVDALCRAALSCRRELD